MRAGHIPSIALMALGLALLAAVFALRGERQPDRGRAFPRGEIVIGVDASFPPFASDDGRSLYGLDIDLAVAIAEQLDLPHRFVNIGYYGLYDALISAEVDMLAAALSVETARMADVRYTRQYFDNGLVLVSPADGATLDAEALAGLSIALEFGSQAESELRKLESQLGQIQRLPYELPRYALDAARLGIADAALVDATSLRLYARMHPDWLYAHEYISHDFYAIAVRIDRGDAWRLIDAALAELEASGQLATIIEAWL